MSWFPRAGHFSAVLYILLGFLVVGCRPSTEATKSKPEQSADSPVISEPTIVAVAWNVESGGNDPAVIAEQLAEFGSYDIVCLSEVHPGKFSRYHDSVGSEFASVTSKTGGSDRLQILFSQGRFELLEQVELHSYRDYELNDGRHRSPLYVRLRDRESDAEFILMTNHLARGNAEMRTRQAIGLREWARDQNAAVIAIGDFNMDFSFGTMKGNEAFTEMVRDNVWQWVQPIELIDTNWADLDGDGKDNYPDSMLDLAFVAGPAKDWVPKCQVLKRDGDFPDNDKTSDHRAIALILKP